MYPLLLLKTPPIVGMLKALRVRNLSVGYVKEEVLETWFQFIFKGLFGATAYAHALLKRFTARAREIWSRGAYLHFCTSLKHVISWVCSSIFECVCARACVLKLLCNYYLCGSPFKYDKTCSITMSITLQLVVVGAFVTNESWTLSGI